MIYIVIIIIIHSAYFVNQNRVVLWSHFTTKEKGGDSPPFLYVLELTAHIHIAAAAAVVVIVWHKAVAAVVCAAVNPDNHDGDDNDNPECFVIVTEKAVIGCAAHIVARIIAAAVIITIHHSKYLRLKIKFTLHTIRKTDFCY